MKADPAGVLTGVHYLDGDYACGEGAMAAGCRFVAGYPITPSTEVVERISQRFPMMGGTFIQMEDELASMAAVTGAAWTGSKVMTVTSGPGFSLMMENIGLATMMEAPCVVVNVQRGGPSTGLPTMVGQGDMMQARWGSHGDYEVIALSPQSPQEAFDLTIEAFNLSETWRVPVMFMMDECVGHMTEKVVIPPAEEIDVVPRALTDKKPGEFKPYATNGKPVPENVRAGDGYRFHTTGLTHDERGYPVMSVDCQEVHVKRLIDKIRLNADQIVRYEEEDIAGADVVVMAYGITARVTRAGIDLARKQGVKVGFLRLIVVWPFPEKRIAELAEQVKAFVVPEINYGQMVLEVERCAAGKAKAVLVPHMGGGVHEPEDICKAIVEAAKMSTPTEFLPEDHPIAPYLRMDRMPHIWCPTCGIGTVVKCFATALGQADCDLDKVAITSGIGCTGRVAGYINLDAFHATHGRAIPFATGLKLGRPELECVVFSGDGDLSGIGGNHFIHAARRNMDLLVILVNNFIYGMTGGQNAPTTPETARSSTMPFGNFERPFNLPHLAASCGATFVSRWTCLHIRRLTKTIRTALGRKGFRFIEVIAPCPTLYARLNRLGSGLSLMKFYHDNSEIQHGADTRDVAIGYQDRFICGDFVDEEQPTFLDQMHSHYGEVLGDRYVPMSPEGGWLHE